MSVEETESFLNKNSQELPENTHLSEVNAQNTTEGFAVQKNADEHYKIFSVTSKELFRPLKSFQSNISFKNSLFQVIPNNTMHGLLCLPKMQSLNDTPCFDDQFLISFIRHKIGNRNEVPTRHSCFCASKNLLNTESFKLHESQNDLLLKNVVKNPREDLKAYLSESDHDFIQKNILELPTRINHGELKSISLSQSNLKSHTEAFNNTQNFKIQKSAEQIAQEEAQRLEELRIKEAKRREEKRRQDAAVIKKKAFRDYNKLKASNNYAKWRKLKPYSVGKESSSEIQDEMVKEYNYRIVNSLGGENLALAIIHNGRKLARLTRHNHILLKQINASTERALKKKGFSEAEKNKLRPALKELNKHIWEHYHAAAKKENAKDRVNSSEVEAEFLKSLESGDKHQELWNHIAKIESINKELPKQESLSKSNILKVNDHEGRNLYKTKPDRGRELLLNIEKYGKEYPELLASPAALYNTNKGNTHNYSKGKTFPKSLEKMILDGLHNFPNVLYPDRNGNKWAYSYACKNFNIFSAEKRKRFLLHMLKSVIGMESGRSQEYGTYHNGKYYDEDKSSKKHYSIGVMQISNADTANRDCRLDKKYTQNSTLPPRYARIYKVAYNVECGLKILNAQIKKGRNLFNPTHDSNRYFSTLKSSQSGNAGAKKVLNAVKKFPGCWN